MKKKAPFSELSFLEFKLLRLRYALQHNVQSLFQIAICIEQNKTRYTRRQQRVEHRHIEEIHDHRTYQYRYPSQNIFRKISDTTRSLMMLPFPNDIPKLIKNAKRISSDP